MHKLLSIENFKCFNEETEIKLGPITACLGSNSVGKSSLIQSCILIRQIYENSRSHANITNKTVTLQLNDIYGLQLGDVDNIRSSRNLYEIRIKLDDRMFELYSKVGSPLEMEVELNEELPEGEGLFSREFYYLNAERLGPRNYQIIDSKLVNSCGIHGENTLHYLYSKNMYQVDERRCFKLDKEKNVKNVAKQVEYWMDYIVPGISIKSDEITDLRLSKVQFQQAALDTGFLSPYNFGFGISYVLPIIVTGLTAEPGSVFLLENPEAHLHPMGQSHIGYFLAMIAFSGVQVIIETHSEHVLNGIRIAALKERKKPDSIAINFFSIINKDKQSKHVVDTIEMNDRMDIQNWPAGFMDQEEEDLRTLRELRRNR